MRTDQALTFLFHTARDTVQLDLAEEESFDANVTKLLSNRDKS